MFILDIHVVVEQHLLKMITFFTYYVNLSESIILA